MPSRLRACVLAIVAVWTTSGIVGHAAVDIPNLPNARLLFTYIMGGGLCNQQYSQITGLLLGLHLDADEIYMPPPHARDSFSLQYHEMTWTVMEHSAVWDMALMTSLVAGKHNKVLVENMIKHDHITERGAAVPEHANTSQIIYLPEVLRARWDIEEWVRESHKAVRAHVTQHEEALKAIEQEKGVVELYLTMRKPVLLGLNLVKVPDAVQVARYVDFTPKLHELANSIVRQIHREYNTRAFNGAHLRIEPDAFAFQKKFQNKLEGVWAMYSEAAELMQFGCETPVFVATAAYQMQDNDLIRQVEDWGRKHASVLLHRDMLLGEEGTQLHSEQLAAVDLLVLAQARSVIGFGESSFSWFVGELRSFYDRDRNSTAVIFSDKVVVDFRFLGLTFDV